MAELPWTKEAHDSGFSVGASAWADAVGTDTMAFADVSVDLQAFSWGAVAAGSAQTGAIAFSDTGDALAANAGVALDFWGADFVFALNGSAAGGGICGDTVWTAQFSSSAFLAVDVTGFTLSCGPLVIEAAGYQPIPGPPGLVEGNLARFDLSNVATGEDTLATSDIQALTVEDQLSSVSAMLLAAVEHVNFSNPDPGTDDPPKGGIDDDDDDDLGGVIEDDDVWNEDFEIVDLPAPNDASRSADGGSGLPGTEFALSSAGMVSEVEVAGTPRPSPATQYETLAANETGLVGGGPLPDDLSVAGEEGGACPVLLPQAKDGAADIYDITKSAECESLLQFRLREGDRLIGLIGWSSDAALRAANGDTLFLERSDSDSQDLMMTFLRDGEWHSLRLDDFFLLNPMFDTVSSDDVLSDDEAMPILRAILQGEDVMGPEAAKPDFVPAGEAMSLLA